MNSPEKTKRLVPATIIPPDLYVERDADRQLALNVRDMGRPGYILVARQMGKTNLLIHAKRTLQSPTVRIVYVDLSVAAYNDERECFRHIVDTAINSHRDIFEKAEIIISDKRKQLRPPNSEHDAELRTLLTHTNSKLIIILDEIDSLVNADFSDRVFAHIRSVYFSRINYPELDRLGYVLSGVAEPNEIIKDKKISPFNIGEKIYLNDFAHNEINQFISQAELTLDATAVERLIFWTGGNPRMLWDICSQLEDQITLYSAAITPEIIDEAVTRFYLTNFDHAPVDHIRELVRDNPDVRSAVRTLALQEGSDLTDTMRTKLYLFGITKASSSVDTPVIKNEIIARALSIDWIKSLATDQHAIFSQAEEQFSRKKYKLALRGYKDYIETVDDKAELLGTSWHRAGMCEYFLGNFEEALLAFSKSQEPSTTEFEAGTLFCMGVCNYYLQKYDESIQLLRAGLEASSSPQLTCEIKLNLGSALLNRNASAELDEAESIFTELVSGQGESSLESGDIVSNKGLEAVSFYNLGALYQKKDNYQKARDAYEKALASATNQSLPAIYIRLAQVASDAEKRAEQLTHATRLCISEKLWPVKYHTELSIAFTVAVALELITQLVCEGLDDLLELFSTHLSKDPNQSNKTLFSWFRDAGRQALVTNRSTQAVALIKRALQNADRESASQLECLGWLMMVEPSPAFEGEYLTLLANDQICSEISGVDVRNLIELAQAKLLEYKWAEALAVVRKAARFRDNIDPVFVRNYVGFDLIEMICLDKLGDSTEVPIIAKRTLNLYNTPPTTHHKTRLFFKESELEMAADYARRSIPTDSIQRHLLNVPDLGRNDKVSVSYLDGRVVRGIKFKKVWADIKSGACKLIKD